MSLLGFDTFDAYATADIVAGKWPQSVLTGFGGDTITIGANGRNGTSSVRYVNADGNAPMYLHRTVVSSGATAIVGGAVRLSAIDGTSTRNSLFSIWDGAAAQTTLRINADGSLSVVRGTSGGTVLGTSAAGLITTIYAYVEFKVVLNASTGSYAVSVNGASVLTGSSANTNGNATTTWNGLRVFTNTGGSAVGTWDVDDLYWCDGSGGSSNDLLGPVVAVAKHPNAAGNYAQFTPNASTNVSRVSDTTPDGDTTYNAGAAAGLKDTFGFAATGVAGTVVAVQSNLVLRSAGGGAETIRPKVRIGGVDYNGTTVHVTTAYFNYMEVFPTSPATGIAWTVAEIDAAEFGYELVS